MVNKHIFQALRFEERYGEGSILRVIERLNNGDTLKAIAYDLSQIHPISIPQLFKYLRTFCVCKHYPSDALKRYYYSYGKIEQDFQTDLLMHEMDVHEKHMGIIYVNLKPQQPSQKTA